jgi:hypothetical protein
MKEDKAKCDEIKMDHKQDKNSKKQRVKIE